MLKTKRNEGEFEITYCSLFFPNTPNDSNHWGILNPGLFFLGEFSSIGGNYLQATGNTVK